MVNPRVKTVLTAKGVGGRDGGEGGPKKVENKVQIMVNKELES